MSAQTHGWGLATDDVILVVEDNDGDARLLELMLREAFGSEVTVARAHSQSTAIAYLAEGGATCVLLDLGLPDSDGVDTVRRVASWAPSAAIVVFTGDDDANTGMAAVQAGAQDYLVKGRASAETVGRAVRYALVRKRAEQTLAQAQRIAHLGSWELDLGTAAIGWSEELVRLFGFDHDQEPDLAALVSRVHPEDRDLVHAAMTTCITNLRPFTFDHRIVLPDESVRWMRAQGYVQRTGNHTPPIVMGTAQDITEQQVAEEALVHQSLHDPLTGLPNRGLLVDRLTQALARLTREPSTLGVIFLDIDRFKVINDSLGHPAGDRVLVAMGKRLSALLRPTDTLARFGGDEFVILCEGLAGEAEARAVADRIHESMVDPLHTTRGDMVVTVSTGIALTTSSQASADSLVRDADAAMYHAKAHGQSRAEVFEPSMRRSAVGRLSTELDMRQSLVDGDFLVHYQPIVDLTHGRIVGAEALVRWQHPRRGLVGPDEFIPVAEETGLIVPLGAWVLRQACQQAKLFQDRDERWASMTMSVNLSGGQIVQPGVVELVVAAIEESGIDPHHLQLEITESVLMDDTAAAARVLGRLKDAGVRLSIDDFGTGYSSLSLLKCFPIDILKIDRSFVDGLGADPWDAAIVSVVVTLAEAMGLDVIAEGIETNDQRATLLELGCERGQGFHFARPVPASDVEALLDREVLTAVG
ncbi:MAG: hypothetical protein QOI47_1372 [Actinomycetota bacterium]|jgi:diguanylate cyclase (GGDEF)-like protein/PAS domain S-box-containing protein|nr:hypothetical protein [Actinomycetota bacterium]